MSLLGVAWLLSLVAALLENDKLGNVDGKLALVVVNTVLVAVSAGTYSVVRAGERWKQTAVYPLYVAAAVASLALSLVLGVSAFRARFFAIFRAGDGQTGLYGMRWAGVNEWAPILLLACAWATLKAVCFMAYFLHKAAKPARAKSTV